MMMLVPDPQYSMKLLGVGHESRVFDLGFDLALGLEISSTRIYEKCESL